MKEKSRCPWPGDDPLMIAYHDREWGKPLKDDRKIFEAIILDTFQAGLSWRTILHKRGNFKKAFSDFDYRKVAKYNKRDIQRLMNDASIIRNTLKVNAAVVNARMFMEVQKEFGTFANYIWQFTDGKVLKNKHKKLSNLRASSQESDAMSKDMKKRGFTFIGSTICYACMQGIGMVNDHLMHCFRYREV